MGKFVQTSSDDMLEKPLMTGTYPAVIEDCKLSDKHGWGKAHPNAQRFYWAVRLEATPEVPEAEGRMVRETTPDDPGIAKQLKKFIRGCGMDPETFDPDDAIGLKVQASVGQGTDFDGDPVNRINGLVLDNV